MGKADLALKDPQKSSSISGEGTFYFYGDVYDVLSQSQNFILHLFRIPTLDYNLPSHMRCWSFQWGHTRLWQALMGESCCSSQILATDLLICMQSNSFSGLESYSRAEHNVSEIGDCRIAEEQGHIFTAVLRIIIRNSSWEYVYNNAKCVVLPIKWKIKIQMGSTAELFIADHWKSCHANKESKGSQKSPTNSCSSSLTPHLQQATLLEATSLYQGQQV